MNSTATPVAPRYSRYHSTSLRPAWSSGHSEHNRDHNISRLRAKLVQCLLDANGKIKAYEKALERNHSSDLLEWKDLDELRKKQEQLAKQYIVLVKAEQKQSEDRHCLKKIQQHRKVQETWQQKQEVDKWYAERAVEAEREYRAMAWQRRLKEVQLRKEAQAMRAHREEVARIHMQREAEAEHNRLEAKRHACHAQYLQSKAKHEAHARELNRLRAHKEAEEKRKQCKLRKILLQEVSTKLAVRHRPSIIAQNTKQHLEALSLKIQQEFQEKVIAECEDQYKEIRIRNRRKTGKPFPAINCTDSRASIQNWRGQNLNEERLIQTCTQ